MTTSILNDIKKMLGLPDDYKAFDLDVRIAIDSALATLNQLGVGQEEGFAVLDEDTTWDDFIGDDSRLNNVKTYVYLKTRLQFDPPTQANLVTAMNEQIKELEWRINVTREEELWKDHSKTT